MSKFTPGFHQRPRPSKLIGRISLWLRGCRQIRGGPSLRVPALARRSSSVATAATARRCARRPSAARPAATGLDIDYDYELARARIAERRPPSAARCNIWRFEELLPIIDRAAQARVGQFSGQTPLIRAERLGAELGLHNLYLKDDSTNRPSLSYKDRVVGDRRRPGAGAGQCRDRLRLDRQRRHRHRLARRQGGAHGPTSSTPPTWSGPRRAAAARSAPRSAS